MNLESHINYFDALLGAPPPLQTFPAVSLFVELIWLGLPEKSVTWLPGIISGEAIAMGLPESLAGSQRSVRRCELVTNNLEQLSEHR